MMHNRILALGSMLLILISSNALANEQTYTFGVVPQQAASVLADAWIPVLAEISARSGVSLRFTTAPNIPAFEQRLNRGEYDFAYMNPYHYVVFHESPGYLAFAREAGRRLEGIIVVAKNSTAKELHDLQNATLAFPSPGSFAATLIPIAELRKQGVDFRPQYVSSHVSVYTAIEKGLFPAGGGVQGTFEMAPQTVRNGLRILWRSKPFSPHAIALRPGLPKPLQENVLRAMLDMSKDPAGKRLLGAIGFSGFENAENRDWDDIRALDIRFHLFEAD